MLLCMAGMACIVVTRVGNSFWCPFTTLVAAAIILHVFEHDRRLWLMASLTALRLRAALEFAVSRPLLSQKRAFQGNLEASTVPRSYGTGGCSPISQNGR